jgi:hypothetical protein
MNRWVLLALLFLAVPVHAAKILVTWVNPTHYERDPECVVSPTNDCAPRPLDRDLANIRIEWGTCTADNQFGTIQSSVMVAQLPAANTSTFIYPSGLTRTCVRGFAITVHGIQSRSSNISVKNLLPSTGKPVTLGQPVIIEF